MFRQINCGGTQKLAELSLKQREQFFMYQRDKQEREWPVLRIAIPPREQHDEEPGSPSRQVKPRMKA